MATYPLILRPKFAYENHLMYNKYVADINKGLARAASDIVTGQALSTLAVSDTLNRNASFLADTITGSTEVINNSIQNLTASLEYGLESVANGIADLKADFDIAMGQVISQFEMLRTEMRTGFDRMINILENRRKTEAREHFCDALEFYRDGCRFHEKPRWFDDALKHFLNSVEQYERNPLAHLHIGHIYHYQKEHRDFEKAFHHYTLCYTYGEAETKDYPVAAQGYFYAGWLSAATIYNLEEAIKLTENALKFDSRLADAHYHLAKFYSLRGDVESAILHLKQCIVDFDRNYCIKAGGDPDFESMRKNVNLFFEQLRKQAEKKFEDRLTSLDRNYDPIEDSWRKKLQSEWNIIDAIRAKGTYFDYLDGFNKAIDLEKLILQAKYSSSFSIIDWLQMTEGLPIGPKR